MVSMYDSFAPANFGSLLTPQGSTLNLNVEQLLTAFVMDVELVHAFFP